MKQTLPFPTFYFIITEPASPLTHLSMPHDLSPIPLSPNLPKPPPPPLPHKHLLHNNPLLQAPVDNLQRLLPFRNSPCDILIPILRNQDIIFDAHASYRVVFLQEVGVDVFGYALVLQPDFF